MENYGYKKVEDGTTIFYYQLNGAGEKYGIEFWKIDKEVYPVCKSKENEAISFTIPELKAINEKVKELGWEV